MLRVRLLNLDGSLAPQRDLFGAMVPAAEWVPARHWGPRVRLACGFREFGRFRDWLDRISTGPAGEQPTVTFYGSGDFHHVTLALLGRIREPFNLLVLDKHPDWMRGIPFLHCGTWLHHALRLPMLRRVFHCGGETDFDNAYRWLAPWSDLDAGRIVVSSAGRRFRGRRWARVDHRPLLPEALASSEVLHATLDPHRDELRRYPLYISVDKDVLTQQDAAVNWDSGLLRLEQATAILGAFLQAAEGRLAGADILGDWSRVRLGNWLNGLLIHVDHPCPPVAPADAAARNRRANAALLGALLASQKPAPRAGTQPAASLTHAVGQGV